MTLLFAHHLEPQHVPVFLMLFAAGFALGWQALGVFLRREHDVIS